MAIEVGKLIGKMINERQINLRERWCWSWGNHEECDRLFRYIFREVDRTFDEYEHLPEYDEIIDWMTNTDDKGLMLMGDCGRGKSVILNYVIPVLFRIKNKNVMSIHAQDLTKSVILNPKAQSPTQIQYIDYLLDSRYPIIE